MINLVCLLIGFSSKVFADGHLDSTNAVFKAVFCAKPDIVLSDNFGNNPKSNGLMVFILE